LRGGEDSCKLSTMNPAPAPMLTLSINDMPSA